METALSTAQQLVATLAAFKACAQAVDAGQQPPDRLLYHVHQLELGFDHLVALVGGLPTKAELTNQLAAARAARDIHLQLATSLSQRVELAREAATRALTKRQTKAAPAGLEAVLKELG